MRRFADFFSVVLFMLPLTIFFALCMIELEFDAFGNSHSLKLLYTVAIESFENYHYECRLAFFIVAD